MRTPIRSGDSRPSDLSRRGALLLLAFISAASCGYRFETLRGGRFSDPTVRINLPPFENRTSNEGVGALLAGYFREELRRDGLAGSFSAAPADYVIEGTVREVREEIVTHDDPGYGQEFRLTLSVDIRVIEVRGGRLLWKEVGIADSAPYFAFEDYSFTRTNRHRALEEACRRLSRRMSRTLRTVL